MDLINEKMTNSLKVHEKLWRSHKNHELFSENIIFLDWVSFEHKRDCSLIRPL